MQYDSHLGDALPLFRVSWNMHDMLMRLVPNLIIQFRGSLRRPFSLSLTLPRVYRFHARADARTRETGDFPRFPFLVPSHTHTHTHVLFSLKVISERHLSADHPS